MRRQRSETFNAPSCGRVDKVSSDIVPRSVFSLDGVLISVEGRPVKKSFRVEKGQSICVTWEEEVFADLEPDDIPLDVLYEDESILVINKPSGLVVHPAPGLYSGTLVNALLFRYGKDFSTAEKCEEDEDGFDLPRPGIVHRLDKDTSGVMVIAKTQSSHRSLACQFASHTTEKVYIAIVKGDFAKRRGTVEKNIVRNPEDRKSFTVTDDRNAGKSAITHYSVIRQFPGYAFVRVVIETGRTHQIRVHMKSIGHPVLGDSIYSRKDRCFPDCTLCLHAMSLSFDHPATGERMTFFSKIPQRMRSVLKELGVH